MDDQEIAQRISGLTNEQRDVLNQLCQARHDQPGADVVVYLPVDPEIAQVLHGANLVWLLVVGKIRAGARDDVYRYWKKHNN